jgi:hypothetical protein
MTLSSDLRFEIRNTGDLIRLEPFEINDDWISIKITVKSGAFGGQYNADLMRYDFEHLKQSLINLDNDFKGTAILEPLEEQLTLKITGDGLGHFETECTAMDQPGCGAQLSFTLNFDQTELKRLINELEKIINEFKK